MSDFKLNVKAVSGEAVPGSFDGVSEEAARAPEMEFIDAWKTPSGEEYVVISGPTEDVVADLVQRSGISVSSVSAISPEVERHEYPNMFPGAKVYCPVHHSYHEPPRCG